MMEGSVDPGGERSLCFILKVQYCQLLHKGNNLFQIFEITASLYNVQYQLFADCHSNGTRRREVEPANPANPLHFRFFTEPCQPVPASTGAGSTSWLTISAKMGKWASERIKEVQWEIWTDPTLWLQVMKTTILEQQQCKTCGWFSRSLVKP